MKRNFAALILILSFGLSLPFNLVFAQETVEVRARKLLEQYKSSLVVITAKGMLKAKTTGEPLPDRDQQRRTLGVTVGDDGLIVVSNSPLDPEPASG